MSFRLLLVIYLGSLFSACAIPVTPPPNPPVPPVPRSTPDSSHPLTAHDLCDSIPSHSVLAVLMDGMEVGREVRSELDAEGPFGPERVFLSHMSLRMTMGSIPFDTQTVSLLKFSSENRYLLYGSHVESDPLKSSTCVVGFDGEAWARRVDSQVSHRDSPTSSYSDLDLSAVDSFGFHIVSLLAKRVEDATISSLVYYEPVLSAPVRLGIRDPLPSSIFLSGEVVDGHWVEAFRQDNLSPVVRAFVDSSGRVLQEEYPTLSQIRRPVGINHDSPLSSELRVGLFSSAYLGDASASTRAVFSIRATPERLDSLSSLGLAEGQLLKRVSPTEFRLEVRAIAPDASSPPVPDDLADSPYIQPTHPSILAALKYLRTAGKSGKLSESRALNATPIVAELSVSRSSKTLWSDPVATASLLSRFVSAVLPNKEHTFSMVDAVTALEKGFGDCTEHSVLLASLLRAAHIPTRLVSGMLLTQGGLWVYHMWNEYWDGSSWRSIDASRSRFEPDAMYVAIGRGASRFSDVRTDLSRFIESAFSGVSFDLVAAWSDGISLPLARPKRMDLRSDDAFVLESLVLSARGDSESALRCIDTGISKDALTLSQKLLRLSFLLDSGRCEEVLSYSSSLRLQTSSRDNLVTLGLAETDCLIRLGRFSEAKSSLDSLRSTFPSEDLRTHILEARIIAGQRNLPTARDLLEELVSTHPDCVPCLAAHVESIVSFKGSSSFDLSVALSEALKVLDLEYWAEADSLLSFSKVLLAMNRPLDALLALDHALVLRPLDERLVSTRRQLASSICGRLSSTRN